MLRFLRTTLLLGLLTAAGGGVSWWIYRVESEVLLAEASADLTRLARVVANDLARHFAPAGDLGRATFTLGRGQGSDNQVTDQFLALAIHEMETAPDVLAATLTLGGDRRVRLVRARRGGPGPTAGEEETAILTELAGWPSNTAGPRWSRWDPSGGRWDEVDPDDWDVPTGLPLPPDGEEAEGWEIDLVAAVARHWFRYPGSGSPPDGQPGSLTVTVTVSLAGLSAILGQRALDLGLGEDILFVAGEDGIAARADPRARVPPAVTVRPMPEEADLATTAARQIMVSGIAIAVEAAGDRFLVARSDLDPATTPPLGVFIARDLTRVYSQSVETLENTVLPLMVGLIVFTMVSYYAVNLRAEVGARKEAETQLIAAKEEAEAATVAKSTFLATMSHEIRTPMNGVMSMAELLGMSRLDPDQRRMTEVIETSAAALLTIINDILDLSKIEAGRLEIERVPFSLMEVVDGAAELLAPRAEDKSLDLLVLIDPGLVDRRLGDPTRIRQVLLNLGGNAVKFTDSGGVRITVDALDDGHLRFRVEDSGIGLSAEQQARLFQPFVQADASTARRFGGTGLGLSISQRLTELMDGEIGVESVAGRGSTFWFTLPLPALEDAAPAPADDLSHVSVSLVGLRPPAAAVARRYLAAAGISRVEASDRLDDAVGGSRLWILSTHALRDDPGAVASITGTVALAGRRADLASLDPVLRARASALVSLPLSRRDLWRAAAVSAGLKPADVIEPDAREHLAMAPPEIETARAATALILVAEDNPTNQVVIRRLMGRLGYAVEIADNGVVAMEMLKTPGYGLLLTDGNMPEMDGFELARRIREEEAGTDRRLPIIALTADAMAGTEERCLDAGMDAYLTKPIDSRGLAALLARYLPHAETLRKRASSLETQAGGDITDPAPDPDDEPAWDRDILDPHAVTEAFGALDEEAWEFLEEAAESWDDYLSAIDRTLAANDRDGARDATHLLKGASLSFGARRVGMIAAMMQDALDRGQVEAAATMGRTLPWAMAEFRATLAAARTHGE